MRVNIYAEEMTDRVEIVSKTIDGQEFTGVRFYLELPATITDAAGAFPQNVRGPFIHRPGDDDSAAVTFWGKKDSAFAFVKAIQLLAKRHAINRATAQGGPYDWTANVLNPDSCWNKARVGEPVFILLGRDPAAPAAIEHWITQRSARRCNRPFDDKLHNAHDIACEMEAYAVRAKS